MGLVRVKIAEGSRRGVRGEPFHTACVDRHHIVMGVRGQAQSH